MFLVRLLLVCCWWVAALVAFFALLLLVLDSGFCLSCLLLLLLVVWLLGFLAVGDFGQSLGGVGFCFWMLLLGLRVGCLLLPDLVEEFMGFIQPFVGCFICGLVLGLSLSFMCQHHEAGVLSLFSSSMYPLSSF